MHFPRLKGLLRVLILILSLKFHLCQDDSEMCDRIPLRSKTKALPPDNRFAIDIKGISDQYIPNEIYEVRLYARDPIHSSFMAFSIFITGDQKPNPKNPRKPIPLKPGSIRSPDSTLAVRSRDCENTMVQADITPKTSVVVEWVAPPKDNKCVTISAYVAVESDVWYSADGPLSRRVCEDYRMKEDMKPPENNNCQVCEEARYQLEFEGTWSYNTHPNMFPEDVNASKFSDIVGASHSKNRFSLFMENTYASDGLKMLAEQGNTTSLEHEILKYLGRDVRTVIKANRPFSTSSSTVTSFRTSREHHYISLAASIIPSPDWFLGTYNLELCDANNQWSDKVVLNLYPMDAGTDSGLTFQASAEPTTPPKTITTAKISQDKSDTAKPFAKIIVTLVRTYENPKCQQTETNDTPTQEENEESEEDNDIGEPEINKPEPTTSRPVVIDSDSSDGCQTTAWEPWLPCAGRCIDNKIKGYTSRLRYYVVDGQIIGKEFKDEEEDVEIPEACLKKETTEVKACEEDCDSETTEEIPEARRGNWNEWVKPGQKWRRWT